jgi:hypothetical protein
MQSESGRDGTVAMDLIDINSTAYEIVKNTWIKTGIWDRKWSVLPGMSWKYERLSLKEMLAEEMGPAPAPREASPPEGEANPVPIQISRSPIPANLNNSSVSGLPDESRELSAALDPAGPENDNAVRSLTASTSLGHLEDSGQNGLPAAEEQPSSSN